MFERYSIGASREDLETTFSFGIPDTYEPCYNASPTKLLPVVTNESGEGLSFFYWGLPPSLAKNKSVSRKLTLAPMDELQDKPSYKKLLKTGRCVIPADGLFFWKRVSKKGYIPHHFRQHEHKPFLMAGLWDEYEADDGQMIHTFTIITGKSRQHDGFEYDEPALVTSEQLNTWLSKSDFQASLGGVLDDSRVPEWTSYPVASLVNNVNQNGPDLVKAAKPMDQFGNYSLFD